MSIIAVNQTQAISQAFSSGVSILVNSCLSGLGCLEAVIPKEYLAAGGAIAACAVGLYLYSKTSATMNDKVAQLMRNCEGKPAKVLKTNISSFIDANWAALSGGFECMNNDKNKKVLYEKLFTIAIHKQSLDTKIQITQNVVQNYRASNLRTLTKIQNDIDTDSEFRSLFNIKAGATILKASRLGSETHHRGDLPFDIHLSDGTHIIYKPRPMASEKAICGHQGSYFARLREGGRDLGTYRVLDKGSYGYCEFLENNPSENTFKTKEDVREYAKRMIVLEQFSKEIGLGDLHNHNIAVAKKMPYTIDTEVVMLPRPKDSEEGMFDTLLLGGLCPGWQMDDESINHIYWKTETGKLRGLDNEMQFFVEFLNEEYEHASPVTTKERELISDCQTELAMQKHRIVLISTEDLSMFIKKPTLDEACQAFMKTLESKMKSWGFEMDTTKSLAIMDKFKGDLLNNDVPVFYFNPQGQGIYYDDLQIGALLP
ncbi:MAG: DUF4135 domain-containing protein [Verrucomicrobia bacterium]|nr:DUF4135 domain-containing protein [Verrucomicrobiota bacterium]